MSLYLARHGKTDWNIARRWQSRTDIPINDTGRGQARQLASLIKSQNLVFGQVFCSPLARARETAEILVDGIGPTPKIDDRLTELDFGLFEGRLEVDLQAELGSKYYEWKKRMYLDPAPRGESILDVAQRLNPLLSILLQSSEHILLVAHQVVNMSLKAAMSNCFTVDCLSSFQQANDEIDVWHTSPPKFISRISGHG